MIDRWRNWTTRLGAILLARFDKWFVSGGAVWQTLGVCVLIVIVEIAWPTLDPHWFWLLVLLTVYSAITQPALAQATSVQTEQLRLIEERQNKELGELNELLTDVHEILRELEDSQRKTDKDHW